MDLAQFVRYAEEYGRLGTETRKQLRDLLEGDDLAHADLEALHRILRFLRGVEDEFIEAVDEMISDIRDYLTAPDVAQSGSSEDRYEEEQSTTMFDEENEFGDLLGDEEKTKVAPKAAKAPKEPKEPKVKAARKAKAKPKTRPKAKASKPAKLTKAKGPAPTPITNRDLAAGTKLVARHGGREYTCTVGKDGEGVFYQTGGKKFSSPSSAGASVTGMACNGWKFWKLAPKGA